jgi:transketolase
VNDLTNFKSTRAAFGDALLELAESGIDIAAVAADTTKSMGVDILRKKYPERCFDCGIAEQNMVMISAGLASTGKTVFAASYSAFTSMRSLEQLRTFVCYPSLNVKIGAGLGGFSAGIEGVTHTALEDIGIVRCLPNLMVLNPADYYSAKKIVVEVGQIDGPCYIRLGRDPSPVIFDENYKFIPGKANLLIDQGDDIGIITSGLILSEVLEAAKCLMDGGIGIKLVEMPTIKPIDIDMVIQIAKSTKKLVTVEEHNITGGLYSAVCEVICANYPKKVYPLAVPDIYTESGKPS